MISRISELFLQRREGLLVLGASLIYAAIGLLDKYVPSVAPVTGFYGWFSLFMPLPLLFLYYKIGGFKKVYESSVFNTAIVLFTAAIPIIIKVKSLVVA